PAWCDILVVPALAVDAVDTVELEPAALDLVPQRAHHAAVFKLKESSLRCGKDDHRQASVAKDQQLHVASEARGEPFMVFTIHGQLIHHGDTETRRKGEESHNTFRTMPLVMVETWKFRR